MYVHECRSCAPTVELTRPRVRASTRAAQQASNTDLQNLFGSYGIEWVEWLNGECVNVLFKDAAKAEKAMQDISEPIPVVEGTPCATLLQWARTVGASCVLAPHGAPRAPQAFNASTRSGATA